MLEDVVRARLGFGEFDGFGYFKEESWWGIIERCVMGLGEKLLFKEAFFVDEIGCGEEGLMKEEKEEERVEH